MDLLALRAGRFHWKPGSPQPGKLRLRVEMLLLEVARRRDENGPGT